MIEYWSNENEQKTTINKINAQGSTYFIKNMDDATV